MRNILEGLDDKLSAGNPEHLLIIRQRQIHDAWEEKVQAGQPEPIYSQDQRFEINTGQILGNHGIFVHEIAEQTRGNKLLAEVAINLRHAYDRRGFSFSRSLASAIADPDQSNDEERTKIMGILLFGERGYDLHVPLLLTRKSDDKVFDFFFMMKLARLDVRDCDTFLEYQMAANFENQIESISRYLQLLIRQFQPDEILTIGTEVVDSIQEWIKLKMPFSSAQAERVECQKIEGNLSDRHFVAFMDHLESVLNAGTEFRIKTQDLELLKSYGLAIPPENNPSKVTLRLNKGDKQLLYHYFHALWEHHGDLKGEVERIEIAQYLCRWFTNFEKVKPESIAEQLRSDAKVRVTVERLFYNQR